MRRPGHLANTAPASGTPESVDGLDLALAARNVVRAGGSAGRFAAAFAAAQRAAAGDVDLVVLAGISAWRAGALAYRDDALAHVEREGGADAARPAVAAALGMREADLDAFVERQRADRFWWPGREAQRGYVCAVGGFAGLGGAWVAPPAEGLALADPGAFAVRTGTQWWRLDADVWGSRLTALTDEPEPGPAGAASLVCFAESYLAWVHVQDAA